MATKAAEMEGSRDAKTQERERESNSSPPQQIHRSKEERYYFDLKEKRGERKKRGQKIRKMEAATTTRTVLVMMVGVVTIVGSHIEGVGAQPACASNLFPCLDAITNTSVKPGSECCSALGKAVKNELTCLCNVYNSPSIFEGFNISRTRALEIPKLCGVSGGLSRCNSTTSGPSPASLAAPTPASGSDKRNGGLRLTSSLMPLWALGFLWVSLIMV